MNRGRGRGKHRGGRDSPRTAGYPPHLNSPQAGSGAFPNDYSGNKEFLSNSETKIIQKMLPSSFSDCKPSSSSAYQQQWRPSGRKDTFSLAERSKEGHKSTESVGMNSKDLNCSVALDSRKEGDISSVSTLSHSGNLPIGGTPSERTGDSKTPQPSKANSGSFSINSPVNTTSNWKPELSEHSAVLSPFDLCPPKAGSSAYQQQLRPSGRKHTFSLAERSKEGHKSTESVGMNSKDLNWSVALDSRKEGDISSVSTLSHSGNLHIGGTASERTGDSKTPQPSKANSGSFSINSPVNTTSDWKPELSEHSAVLSPFDLCPPKAGGSVMLKASLLVQNREKRNEIKRSMGQQNGSVLQSGMVLLKNYLPLSDQINIVKLCRDLGLGPGGFYQPGYRDGAKLNLKMMCLGKNWDPETSKYGEHRPIDGAKPPSIPVELFRLVEGAIKESHSLIRKDSKASNSEGILPWMTPDICLVNFYSSTGRLGLHQDCDESEQSLHKGLPVVSFSIGDAAEFLYGEQRDVDRANKIILESGDVLIFGGKSRHVFHGVASIQPNTAPKTLLEKTNLRPGRLNLTFRQYCPISLIFPFANECSEANKVVTKKPALQNVLLAWAPPLEGWSKLNVDGSRRGDSGHISAGGLLRNNSGGWLCGFTVNIGTGSVLEAELWGLLHGLQLSWTEGYRLLEVECDSQQVVSLVSKNIDTNHPQFSLICACKELTQRSWTCNITPINRKLNQAADHLAYLGSKFDRGIHLWDVAPDSLQSILDDDVRKALPRLVVAPEHSAVLSPFDLCPPKAGSSVILKAPLLVQNREKRNEIKRSMGQQKGSVLQSGMVLLKNYLSLSDQINIVKLCRDLGLGPGGFYQPGYRDGAKLNLKMMCLGKNWDPETSKYGDHRPIDGAKPPRIPVELFQLVESAINESHSLIRNDSKASNAEGILPWMTPDICRVNFYSSSGRLGLHQDRDESEQSLLKGLPVVSFSIGDAAEFLYGEQRDVNRANKIMLESGDVLIFGGKSRHVFHGVASIQPNTAPKTLLEKTNLRPGRLNLTFRQY